jgi:hypothetical protein
VTPTENSLQKMKIVHSSLKSIQNITCGGEEKRRGGLQNFLRNCWNSCIILGLHAFIVKYKSVHLPKAESPVFFFN